MKACVLVSLDLHLLIIGFTFLVEKVAHIEADLFEVGHISSPGFPNIYPSPQNATSYQYIIQHKGALDKLFIRVVFDDHDLAPRDKLKVIIVNYYKCLKLHLKFNHLYAYNLD